MRGDTFPQEVPPLSTFGPKLPFKHGADKCGFEPILSIWVPAANVCFILR